MVILFEYQNISTGPIKKIGISENCIVSVDERRVTEGTLMVDCIILTYNNLRDQNSIRIYNKSLEDVISQINGYSFSRIR